MSIFSALILGAVQGLTELWPISSSAHLYLLSYFTGWADLGLTMTVFLHFGTLLAVVSYFYRDWFKIITDNRRLLLLIIMATLPAAIAGFLLEAQAETIFRAPLIIVGNLVLFGLLLGWSDRWGQRKLKLISISWSKVLLIGIGQALAIIPGVSRSGATITAGLFLGLTRSQAARFSFLLLAPILFGAFILRFLDFLENGVVVLGGSWSIALVGLVSSFIFSYLALALLFRFLEKNSFWPFVIYRIVLAVVVLLIYLC
jgi:undecaprenyl-diphosphatase